MYNEVQLFLNSPVANTDVPTLSLNVSLAQVYDQLVQSQQATGIDLHNAGGPVGSYFSGNISLKVAAWFREPSGTMVAAGLCTPAIPVRLQGGVDLSTSPDDAENKDEEKIVLLLLSQSAHLFYDDLSSWSWNMASTAHAGTAINAIDFVRSNANLAPVVAPYAGTVVFNGKDSFGNSTLVLEHHVEIGGRTIYWYTKYLHMHVTVDGLVYILDAQGNQQVLLPGRHLEAGDTIGLTGEVGHAYGEHLHEETLIAPNGSPMPVDTSTIKEVRVNGVVVQRILGAQCAEFFITPAVDQRLLLTTHGRSIHVQATAGRMDGLNFIDRGHGTMTVQWHGEVGWVDEVNHLVYDRKDQENSVGNDGNSTWWLAWEPGKTVQELESVKHVQIDLVTNRFGWVMWNSQSDVPKLKNGRKQEWTPNASIPWTPFD